MRPDRGSGMVVSPRQAATRALTLAVLIAVALLILLPLFYMVVIASRPNDGTLSILWFEGFALWSNLGEVFDDPRFFRFFTNSMILSTVTASAECVLAGAAGYALAKLPFPGRRALFSVVVATLALSPVVMIVPLYDIVQRLGWTSSYPGLIIPLLLTGLGVFLVRQFALGIPDGVIDAARVDGASEMRIFFQVALPLLRPAMLTLFLIVFVTQWDNLLWPLAVSRDSDFWTLPVGLRAFQTEFGVSYRLLMTGTLFAVLPPLALFALLQRYYVRGLSLGSVKG